MFCLFSPVVPSKQLLSSTVCILASAVSLHMTIFSFTSIKIFLINQEDISYNRAHSKGLLPVFSVILSFLVPVMIFSFFKSDSDKRFLYSVFLILSPVSKYLFQVMHLPEPRGFKWFPSVGQLGLCWLLIFLRLLRFAWKNKRQDR